MWDHVGQSINANCYPLVMTNGLLLKITIEIVDFPIDSMVIFHSYVSLPEANLQIKFQ